MNIENLKPLLPTSDKTLSLTQPDMVDSAHGAGWVLGRVPCFLAPHIADIIIEATHDTVTTLDAERLRAGLFLDAPVVDFVKRNAKLRHDIYFATQAALIAVDSIQHAIDQRRGALVKSLL